MLSATELLYQAAQSQDPTLFMDLGLRPKEPCGLCGGTAFRRGIPLRTTGKGKARDKGWLKPTFTAYPQMAHYHPKAWICEACLFSMREWIPLCGRDNQKMRTYSHLVEGDNWQLLTKAETGRTAIREFLLRPHAAPWFACVATSGQKHLLFLARTNPPTHGTRSPVTVQVETESVSVVPDELRRLLSTYEALYSVFSKAEINSGDYGPRRLIQMGLPLTRLLDTEIAKHRGSRLFELAAFLAVKKEQDSDDIQRTLEAFKKDTTCARVLCRHDGGDKGSLSPAAERSDPGDAPTTSGERGESSHPLGSSPGSGSLPGTADRVVSRVDGASDAPPANRKPQQLSLFGH